MAHIQILGTGCSKCAYLLKHAEQAVEELGREDKVEKIDDIVRILDFNPLALPAMAIDGQVITAGTIPSVEEIKNHLAHSSSPKPLT